MKSQFDNTLTPDVSVCIVTYNSSKLLGDCLKTLANNTSVSYEINIADNNSQDDLEKMLKREFPAAKLIKNLSNLGYTIPMNMAFRQSRGRYLMQLNPDTIIHPGAVDKLVDYLETHPRTGIVGPKVLNRDQTLQKSCRRGEPTPIAVFSYFLGLSRIFPKSKFFGGYQLNYLNEDLTHPVAGVAGSCMLFRGELLEQIGYLDEQFFAYQEDADYCRRARESGWEVIYYPESQITHFGGEGGSMVEPQRAIIAWHQSYYRYYRKHLAKNYFFLLNWLFYLAMFIRLGLALMVNCFRKEKFISTKRP